jgi:spore coat protein JB
MEELKHMDINLLKEIQDQQFAVLETSLYLNTHPGEQRALDLHNDYAMRLGKLEQEYNDRYSPLTIYCGMFDYPWEWINEPWPWEINY